MARPSSYTPELAESIFERMKAGEALAVICEDAGMPSIRTVLRWAVSNAEFDEGYQAARNAQAEKLDAQIQAAAFEAHDKDSASAARVKIAALQWRAAKLAPKRYGERIDVDMTHRADLANTIDQRIQRIRDDNRRLGLPTGEAGK